MDQDSYMASTRPLSVSHCSQGGSWVLMANNDDVKRHDNNDDNGTAGSGGTTRQTQGTPERRRQTSLGP